MVSRAITRYIRIAPRKVRQVIDLVRGKPVLKAGALLGNLPKRPAMYIKRTLFSAIDSADKRLHIPASELYISLIKADTGPVLKRFRAMSMGRAGEILHRTTNITVELDRIKTEDRRQKTEDRGQKIKTKKTETIRS